MGRQTKGVAALQRLQDGLSGRSEKEDKGHYELRRQQQYREQAARKDDAPLHSRQSRPEINLVPSVMSSPPRKRRESGGPGETAEAPRPGFPLSRL